MPRHNFERPRGTIIHIAVESEALRNNLLGDPATRDVALYLPEGYDDTDADYPLFVGLAGFTGSGLKLLSWQSFGENLPQRLDRLFAAGSMGPVVAAFPDGFTSLGGNQYVDSPVMGNWERFLQSIDIVLRDFPAIVVDDVGENDIKNGKRLTLERVDNPSKYGRAYAEDGRFLGILCRTQEKGVWQPKKVFI